MWPLFALGVVSVTLFLYIPGFILLRSTRLSSFNQLLCAPVASLLLLIAISVALSIAGVACAWHVVVGLSFVIALLTFLLHSMLVRKRLGRAPHRALNSINKKQLMQLALYLAVSLCVGIYFYVRTLDSPMSIYQENDCFFHLNLIRQHVESQTYYSLSMGSYPQAWHCIAGLAADLLGGHVTIAANVVNLLFFLLECSLFFARFFQTTLGRSRVEAWLPLLLQHSHGASLFLDPFTPTWQATRCFQLPCKSLLTSWSGRPWGLTV